MHDSVPFPIFTSTFSQCAHHMKKLILSQKAIFWNHCVRVVENETAFVSFFLSEVTTRRESSMSLERKHLRGFYCKNIIWDLEGRTTNFLAALPVPAALVIYMYDTEVLIMSNMSILLIQLLLLQLIQEVYINTGRNHDYLKHDSKHSFSVQGFLVIFPSLNLLL